MIAPSLLRPGGRSRDRLAVVGILACLGVSVVSLAVAPMLMSDGYSWVTHTTSESAAQGVEGAWLARVGFVLSGLGVLWLVGIVGGRWDLRARALHAGFGVFMLATAAFSARSWETGSPFDRTEDLLHSIVATAMVFAFTFGVVAVLVQRVQDGSGPQLLDVVAVAASLLVSIGMAMWGDGAGVLQRTMLLIVFTWYAAQAVAISRSGKPMEVEVGSW